MADTGVPAARSTWQELRRRKVVQWGLAYVAVAWGLVQGVAFAVGTYGWPELITRVAGAVAAVGLPLTVTLAWFHGDRGEQRITRVEIVVLALLVALGAYAVATEVREARKTAVAEKNNVAGRPARARDRHRIAILPFDNLGGIAANAAFVGGVHDTLITQVAKIPGLSVIARSSVLQFADQRPTIAQVAAALDVGAVLEGSVEREGDRLRVQTQLIDANTDAHLWAETYDRRTDDLFAVQSEIAQAVAEQLRIRLTSGETRRLTSALSNSPAAYEHYVLGRNYLGAMKWPEAIQEMTAAVTRDPQFAAAYAYLSIARTWTGFFDASMKAATLPLAREAAEKALALDPTLPEGHLAMAVYLYRGEPDIDAAAREFERAIAGLPNDSIAHSNFGYLRRWQGRWEEASALFRRAAELDPRSEVAWPYVTSLVALRREADALQAAARARAANPGDATMALPAGYVPLIFRCDIATADREFRGLGSRFPASPEALAARVYLALTTGEIEDATPDLERLTKIADRADLEASMLQILSYRAIRQRATADALARRYLADAERQVRGRPEADIPSDWFAQIGVHYALLGDARLAHEYVTRSIRALPASGDASNRMATQYFAAVALAWANDPRGSVEQLGRVLAAPNWYGASGLWCDPYLAPLRSYPPFRQLLAEHGADTSIDPLRRETWPKP